MTVSFTVTCNGIRHDYGGEDLSNTQWKHKIGGSVGCGTILVFMMTAGMAALCLWFHKTGNGTIVLGRIILTIFAAAFVLSLYRTIFFKVLIGKDGFYYQSAPGNGRYFRYSEIRRAWISSGRETNARTAIYLGYETRDGKTIKISITGADTDAAEYMIERVTAVSASGAAGMEDAQGEYLINAKVQGITGMTVLCAILAIILWFSNSLAREGLPPISYALPRFTACCALAYMVMHYFFYKIEIKRDGFYCRTNPFNGRLYRYRDIADCRLVERRHRSGSARHHGTRTTHYLHYLVFTDRSGKERRIRYDRGLFEREIRILFSRMEQGQSRQSRITSFDNPSG